MRADLLPKAVRDGPRRPNVCHSNAGRSSTVHPVSRVPVRVRLYVRCASPYLTQNPRRVCCIRRGPVAVDGVRLVLEESRCHAKDPPLDGSVNFRFPQAQVLSRSMMMCCSKECPSWVISVDFADRRLFPIYPCQPTSRLALHFVGTGQDRKSRPP